MPPCRQPHTPLPAEPCDAASGLAATVRLRAAACRLCGGLQDAPTPRPCRLCLWRWEGIATLVLPLRLPAGSTSCAATAGRCQRPRQKQPEPCASPLLSPQLHARKRRPYWPSDPSMVRSIATPRWRVRQRPMRRRWCPRRVPSSMTGQRQGQGGPCCTPGPGAAAPKWTPHPQLIHCGHSASGSHSSVPLGPRPEQHQSSLMTRQKPRWIYSRPAGKQSRLLAGWDEAQILGGPS